MVIRKSHLFAGLLAAGLVAWLLSGQIGETGAVTGGDEDAAGAAAGTEAGPETAAVAVRVRDLVAEPVERAIVASGETAAVRSVAIKAETDGRVIELGADEGASVEAGERLVTLDPRDREIAVAEAKALLRQRRIELDAATRLGEKGFQSETTVAAAEAAYAAAEAALKRAELSLEHTVIRAPFAGVLDDRAVEIGDFVDIGNIIATVLDRDPLLVVADVTETEVGRLEPGMTGSARLATGRTLEGTVSYVASEADAATRTFRVELEVPNDDGRLAAGISAEVTLDIESLPAHAVPPSALTLSDAGELGVKIVEADRAVFHPVEIVRAEESRLWLAGLPREIRLITIGQDFVLDGSEVEAVPEGDGGEAGEAGPLLSSAAAGNPR